MFVKWISFAALLTVATICRAAVPGEVIVAYDAESYRYAVVSPDGSNFAYVACGGDPTRNGAPRFYLTQVRGTNVLRQDSVGYLYNSELVAVDEECMQSFVLTNEGNKTLGSGKWAPDGYTIAAAAAEFDVATQERVRGGIYLADVVYTGDRPTGATNLRLVIPVADGNFDWSPDSSRIVYEAGPDLFVYTIATGASVNITNTPESPEEGPTWSSTGRIAYWRVSELSRSGNRTDLFSIPDTGGTELRITSKANATSTLNGAPCYSPDGQHISFVSGSYPSVHSPTGNMALHRIKADGTGKSVKILGRKSESWTWQRWRR